VKAETIIVEAEFFL